MKIAIFGATGMLGSTVLEVFSKTNHEIVATARKQSERFVKFDAQNFNENELISVLNGCDYAINCIGIIKPYIHDDNSFEVQRAIEVNGLFPHKLAKAAEKTGTKIIQIATDCVFDGAKGNYLETDKHNALDVYGKTKSLGEVVSENVLNLRCSIIGPELKGKTSLLEWFLNQPRDAQINGFTNHLWNGVTTLAFAKICVGLIENNSWHNGLQHIVPDDFVTKAQLLKDFAIIFDRKDIKIKDFGAQEAIDRTILTNNPLKNQQIWKNAGYFEIPKINKLVEEMKETCN